MAVKEPIVLPFVFLLIFIAALAVFSVLDLFSAWGYSSAGVQSFSIAYAAQKLPHSALQSLVPAALTALILCGFRAARKPISRFLVLIILLAASYAVLVNGMLLLKGAGNAAAAAPAAARLYMHPRAFLRIGNSVVNARSVTDTAANGALVYKTDAARGERFTVHPTGRVTLKNGTFSVRFDGAKPIELSAALPPAAGRLFEADPFTASFLRDMGVLTSDFVKLLASSRAEFFLAAFALLFLSASSMVIMRLTRWPLINALLFIAAVRGYLLLYHFLSVTAGPEISKGLTDPFIARIFPSVAFIVLGVLFLTIDILFIRAGRNGEGETA
jgi:hypothetical protein